MYNRFVKRLIDLLLAIMAIVLFWWIFLVVALFVRVKLGSPVLFSQYRPGKKDKSGKEVIFKLYKFRTMTDEKDNDGNLLPDEKRMTKFGSWLRNTSLDELPEIINILKGEMSFVGPRPQLVRDMVFMTDEQRKRHNVRPGLSGLAQVRGRNAISWENKLKIDLEYIEKISFLFDLKIICMTVFKVIKREGITEEGMATAADYGDYLLNNGMIEYDYYCEMQEKAKLLLLDLEKSNGKL